MIEITPRALEVLAKAAAAAARFDPAARIRLGRDGGGIRSGFTHEPEPGDEVIETDGAVVFVEAGIVGIVDVAEPHDRLVLRAEGDG